MNLLDIIGPVMVGPSSSHTAGAVKIGRVSRKLHAEEEKEARIGLAERLNEEPTSSGESNISCLRGK